MSELTGAQSRLIDAAAAASAGSASLSDIEHVVILMQENRSFDHYFGTLSGVRGFSDPHALRGVFGQSGYQPGTGPSLAGYLEPFRLYSEGIDYPLPATNSMPSQETSPPRPPVP